MKPSTLVRKLTSTVLRSIRQTRQRHQARQHDRERTLRRRGIEAWWQGDRERASILFQRSVRAGGRHGWSWLWLGRAQTALGNPQLGISSFQRALQLQPELVKTRLYLADAYIELNEISVATRVLNELADTEAARSDPLLLADVARRFLDIGDYEAAVSLSDRIAGSPEDTPSDVRSTALIVRAHIFVERKMETQAVAIAHEIVAQGEGPAQRDAAFLLLDHGDPLEGWRVLSRLDSKVVTPRHLLNAARRLLRRGHLRTAEEAVQESRSRAGHDVDGGATAAQVAGQLRLLRHGLKPEARHDYPVYEPSRDRVLYVLHNSLPYASGGYATRTHGLLTALSALGIETIGATRLGYPHNRLDAPPLHIPNEDRIDGVRYVRLRDTDGPRPLDEYIKANASAVELLARLERPAVLHAASNYWTGIATNLAGARLGIPTVYEVRGLWEITRISREPRWSGCDAHILSERMEAEAAAGASAVITITRGLQNELVRRGVPEDKITLVPNSVDVSRFESKSPDIELGTQLGVQNTTVIGYVGTLTEYEGLDDLLTAVAQLKQRRPSKFKVLIVGDGTAYEGIQAKAAALDLLDTVIFTGRVPHPDVERYYSLIDIVCMPRKPLPVTEMVSPIKPLEAMAMGKAVVVSSVAALEEIVASDQTGLVFQKGRVTDLADKLDLLLSSPALVSKLGEAARDWVRRERNWTVVARRVLAVYDRISPTGSLRHNCSA